MRPADGRLAPGGDVVEAVREQLARQGAEVTPARVAAALRDQGRPVGDAAVLAVHDRLTADVLGAGPLEPLLRTPGVTDVLVNGPHAVYLDRGEGLELTTVRFPDDDAVRRLAQRLAAAGGRRLDDATPYADLRLPDGTRFHAVLAPLSRPGTSVSLRVPRRRVFTLDELVAAGSLDPLGARLLRRVVAARLSFLVSGGTGTGKTTLLSALLSLVDPGDRLVLVEDASELRPDHPHVVGLESRPANVEGAGEVPMRVLVRQALRMRPDRLVVGEVRGAEVADLLAALNTGHEGGCGTLHANSAADVPARVEALAMAAGLPQAAVHSQLASAVDVVVHLGRDRAGRRRLVEVAVLDRAADGAVRAIAAALAGGDGATVEGPGAGRLGMLLDDRSST
ncbi:MAG TPA: TadA family conjugal transfer-associated ATPase [Nocardioides sp.]|uniref:TadA family conjugal transfer-associated ATPase n=1 Tax=Nocardioides sp. TaxID=35761 RepID=UPI002D7F8913|nr:TadA family conjugal transfer-associated ATPase [Nocardioides sp.]HET6651191.1 TadA family conjugal transfer-associated ATPase [Nocardioides sp.]